ncbi:hypothetical protein RJT34_15071 [Clitoria ternatea]|uniref:Uncharacterized protein n=1 Tax=Clitoria ternatea TaxID=43366 RepID=A0AAN9JTH7_CLITE
MSISFLSCSKNKISRKIKKISRARLHEWLVGERVESAPPELEQLFTRIYDEYTEWVGRSGRQLPPQWAMPDLVRTVLGEESINIPDLRDAFYDVMLHGPSA